MPLVATVLGCPRSTRNFVAGAFGGFAAALIWNELFGKPLMIEGFVIGAAVNVALFMAVPSSNTGGRAGT